MDDRGAAQRNRQQAAGEGGAGRHPFLVALGQRVHALRSRRGMTRKEVSLASNVSERHLANLEHGTGNASVLILFQVAKALQCSVSELIGDVTTSSPEWLMIREHLANRSEAELRKVRVACTFGQPRSFYERSADPVALFFGQLMSQNCAPDCVFDYAPLFGLDGAKEAAIASHLAKAERMFD